MGTYKLDTVSELLAEKKNISDKINTFLKQFGGNFENFSTEARINSENNFLLYIKQNSNTITLNLEDIRLLTKLLLAIDQQNEFNYTTHIKSNDTEKKLKKGNS